LYKTRTIKEKALAAKTVNIQDRTELAINFLAMMIGGARN